ncbi:MAG: amidohydrolase [Anaerolineaceae bacterium]|nr:amidohydrolase [Anaerolineaceae bacterium]
MTSKNADLLIENAKILAEKDGAFSMVDAAVAIGGGRILEVGKSQEVGGAYTPLKTWNAKGKLLLPGFINTHCHLFQVFMRGLGKDLPFMDWMNGSVRLLMPMLDDEAVYLAVMVGCMEALRTGTTTLVDFMYANVKPKLSDAVLRAFDDCGIRGVLARGLTDVDRFPGSPTPPSSGAPVAQSLEDVERMRSLYQGNPRISFMLAPSVIWAMTREGLAEASRYALANDMVVTMHLLETSDDDAFSQEKYGMRTTRALEEIGVLETNFLAVHTVRLEKEDFDLFEQYGTRISHNPVANMILGSGAAPISKLTRLGIPISLGTDGAASNDSQNLIEVMKSAALLQKVRYRDTAALSAKEVFSMATDQGAVAIEMGDQIGEISPGKRADIVVVDLEKPNTTPCYDPISSLVYSGSEQNISSVFVEGALVIEDRAFTRVDEKDILRRAQSKAQALYQAAKAE